MAHKHIEMDMEMIYRVFMNQRPQFLCIYVCWTKMKIYTKKLKPARTTFTVDFKTLWHLRAAVAKLRRLYLPILNRSGI